MATHTLLHKDDQVLVVAKAKGVLTTPAHGEEGLVDELDRLYVARERLAVVHRLDKDTSGILVFARTKSAATMLAEQFSRHVVVREYVAVVSGRVATESGTITQPVLGKRSVTDFRVESRDENRTTLVLRLKTGRRNQIRRHVSSMGYPILGDVRFGGPPWDQQGIALHARVLGFNHPKTRLPLLFDHSEPYCPEFGGNTRPKQP